jgi:Domain of unknown function (DUF4258)
VKKLAEIQHQIQVGEFEFTRHAFKRAVERNISELEIMQAGANVIIIEDYPDDKYAPSCLLLGLTILGKVLHLQVSLMDSDLLRIITIYEPNENEWIDYKTRRA